MCRTMVHRGDTMHLEALNILDWVSLVLMVGFIGMTIIVNISKLMAPPSDED